MIEKIYIDTSVFGGYFDIEFEKPTKLFFNELTQNKSIILLSEITISELENAPFKVRELVNDFTKSNFEYLQLNDEVVELAENYLKEKVVGKTSRNDCLHISLATINRASVLVSWNFKHIVNVQRIRNYNSINIKYGYPILDIRSPLEVINCEE